MSTSNVINRVTESRNVIWDVGTQSWIAMQQPILNAGSVTIPGTVTVSGIVSVSNLPVTQPVSGTFFQATQPVSLATAPTTPVTGTFFQATQPVSLASAPTTPVTNASLSNLDVALSTRTKPSDQQHAIIDSGTTTVTQGTGSNLHVVVDSAPSTPVTGPLTDTQLRASAVPTSLAVLPALVASSAVIGHVVVDTAPTTAITVASLPLPSNAAQETNGNLATISTNLGTVDDSASDIFDSSGTLNAKTRRLVDQLGSLIEEQSITHDLLFRILLTLDSQANDSNPIRERFI